MPEGEYTIWCLLGKKAGDNTQVTALAEEVGYPYQEKRIVAQPWELAANLGLKVTLAGIDRQASSVLEPPWPDLLITAGRRNEPVARWIQRQSGGRTRLVHIGRPWAPLSCWDLIVTTPQYFLPRQDNVLHNELPLHRHTPDAADQAGAHWSATFADLPRPWIALLVGGDSGRFVMTESKGARLGVMADDLARATGGSLLITDSPRTPRRMGDTLQEKLTVPHYLYRFSRGGENPYAGLLALADAFIVTGESMSMLAEASDTGKPLFIFDPGDGRAPWWMLLHNYRYKPLSFRLAMRYGPARMRRDVGRIQSALVDAQRARWLSAQNTHQAARLVREALAEDNGDASPTRDDLERAASAVRQLLTQR